MVLVTRAPSEELLAERRRLGLDTHDEIWAGEHHLMTPGPAVRHAYVGSQLTSLLQPRATANRLFALTQANIGVPDDFRVPDATVIAELVDATYLPTAALVAEVASPGDDSWRKFDFYAAHDVDEVLIADPDTATLHWFRLDSGRYVTTDRSEVLAVDVAELHAAIDWPEA